MRLKPFAIWAVLIGAFVGLTGCYPFQDRQSVKKAIYACEYEAHKYFPSSPLVGWSCVSAREQLTSACLRKDGYSESNNQNCLMFASQEEGRAGVGTTFRLNVEACWELK
jgi:hypothetical protein